MQFLGIQLLTIIYVGAGLGISFFLTNNLNKPAPPRKVKVN